MTLTLQKPEEKKVEGMPVDVWIEEQRQRFTMNSKGNLTCSFHGATLAVCQAWNGQWRWFIFGCRRIVGNGLFNDSESAIIDLLSSLAYGSAYIPAP